MQLWMLALIGALFGALPDLIGAYGNLILQDHWGLYHSAHHGSIAYALQYVPMYGLHLFIDSFAHGPGRRWWMWSERFWLEVLLWAVNIVVICWFFKVWKRNEYGASEHRTDSEA